ncbi:3'-5' exonuclease [Armatimonas rosea]|uniref:Inhibitor of KinA sporulation pathway (Predicted exonuclease) n=1 Tax=Armatimonas rosea TaxID=685828 RepID=A0A7W9SQ29_ARMRO|nr:3'-5' exonuclease [Armatimonas rosea]MBB6050093.1 inhibitor of KinA sporulation pathway (predicted exonuclease) [Armatimonas rosea]
MRFIIVDLEATCRESGMPREEMEIIEIGAVELLSPIAEPTREFSRFVRPTLNPELSAFCTQLTGISQRDVDRAEGFSTVFPAFLDWIGPEPYTLCSWGAYDLTQFLQDLARHGLTPPPAFNATRHLNLKKRFADKLGTRPLGMATALRHVGLPLLGRHHRGIDDAYNIAALARLIL